MSAVHDITFVGMPDGHLGQVRHGHEWGGPTTARAVCSCGWSSVTYDEYLLYQPDAAVDGCVGGRPVQATADLLDHLGYDPHVHTAAVQELAARVADGDLAHAAALQEELARHRHLREIADTTPPRRLP